MADYEGAYPYDVAKRVMIARKYCKCEGCHMSRMASELIAAYHGDVAKPSAEYQRQRREQARDAGLCSGCAKNPTVGGYKLCEGCRGYARSRQKVVRDSKKGGESADPTEAEDMSGLPL